jgi:hypothetical protein
MFKKGLLRKLVNEQLIKPQTVVKTGLEERKTAFES